MKTFFPMIRRILDAALGTGYLAWISTVAAFGVGIVIGQFGPALLIEPVHAASSASPDVSPSPGAGQTPERQPRVTLSSAESSKGKSVSKTVANSKTAASNKKSKHDKQAATRKGKQVQASASTPPKPNAQPTEARSKPADTQSTPAEAQSKPATTPIANSAAAESKAVKSPRGSSDDLARAGDAIALGRNSEAMTLLRKVLAADPLNIDARGSLIALMAERGRNDEWLAELSEAADVAPERFALTAASAHFEMNRVDDASAILSRIPPASRDFRHYAFAGVIYTRLQQYVPALSAYDKALALNTGNASKRRALLVARGVALEHLGRKDEARSAYQATIEEGGSASALNFARTRLANLDLDTVSVDRP